MTTLDTVPVRTDPSARRFAGTALVVAGALGLVAAATVVGPGTSPAERLALLDAAGPRATVSVLALTLMQPFLLAGLLGLTALLRPRAPRLAATGLVFAVAGAVGEAVSGGQSLVLLAMAHDAAHRDVYAALLPELTQPPAALFALLGLVGSVLGLLLLSLALFRTRTGPRWVAPALWAFLLLEYVGSVVVPALGVVGVLAALAAFVALARELRTA